MINLIEFDAEGLLLINFHLVSLLVGMSSLKACLIARKVFSQIRPLLFVVTPSVSAIKWTNEKCM